MAASSIVPDALAASSPEDHEPARRARALGVSREAIELVDTADVVDLHVDTFIWTRILGYDPRRRHGRGPLRGHFLSQVDLPRLRDAGIDGAVWSITTNPLPTSARRAAAFAANLRRLRDLLASPEARATVVRTAAEYRAARIAGRHAAFVGIQGANALDRDGPALDLLVDDVVVRVTLVHLTSSSLGHTSSPLRLGPDAGLTARGQEMVRQLEQRRILVDLAHVSPRGFWDAVRVHDRSRPLVSSHTGVSAVTPHWRNLDDEQIRAIADSGGTVGIIYHRAFLGPGKDGDLADAVAAHLQHLLRTVGDDHASLGSDWDGMISPPRDMRTCLELPVLVQRLLDRGVPPLSIVKILGANFLRVVATVRG